ncbi:MAG: hypothetical protein H6R18_1908 [Proteobacteria bacterium]|nr:hypothetical protein [Pseudomonadota bacterium]
MTTITLEAIKTEQNKIAQMIATLEAQAKLESAFPITIEMPTLNAGERYVGAIISADGRRTA